MKFDARALSVTKQRRFVSRSRFRSCRSLPILVMLILSTSSISFLIINSNKSESEYVANMIQDILPKYENIQHYNKFFKFTNFSKRLNKTEQQFWESIVPSFNCPANVIPKVGGEKDGGKWTCGIEIFGKASLQIDQPPCMVYSFGLNEETSFELDVLELTTCQIFAYDAAVGKIDKLLRFSNNRVHFKQLGISFVDQGKLRTLKTLMKDNGDHVWTDILKMNLEHWEYPGLERILKDFPQENGLNGGGLPFGQLLVKMQFQTSLQQNVYGSEQIIKLFQQFEQRGLRMFYKEVTPIGGGKIRCKFSFKNINRVLPKKSFGEQNVF